jgi:hypothetical protein
MKGLFIGLIVEFIKTTVVEAREALKRRNEEKRRKALEAKRRKLIEEQEKKRKKYLADQARLKEEIRKAQKEWKEHWKATNKPRPIPDNPYDEETPENTTPENE